MDLIAALSDPALRASLPAGMRNNNPGNIKYVGQRVPGIVGPSENTDQGDPQAVFDTPESGFRAMYGLLAKKYAGGKITANDIIAGKGGWTPGNYQAAANVARAAGIRPDQDINFNDPQMAARFMRGLVLQEHGKASDLYPDSMIVSAISGEPTRSPAVAAVNNLAEGNPVPRLPVQSVNFVPPPFSQQQGNYTPLIGDQPAPQSQAPQAIERAPAPPVVAPDANQDPLKAWGIDAEQPAAGQQPPAAPEQDILKAWGVDPGEPTPAGDLAGSQNEAPADTTFGQKVGNAIDTAAEYAAPVAGFVNNVGRQIATGVPVIGGALNKADAATNALIAPVLNPLFSKENQLQGNTFGERYQNSLAMQNGQDQQFQSDHPVISTGAQIAGGIGALGGAASAIPGAGTALGLSGNLATRTVAGGLSGAALGGADAAVRSEGDPEAIKRGAEFGGAVGLVAPAAGAALGGAVNKLFGGSVPERVAQLAQLARDKYGVNVGPGQLSTNPTIKFLDSVVNRLPMSGGTAAKEAQQQAFNSAVANSFGETAKEVTPEVIDAAKGRIGKVFDSVAERTPAIKADGQFQDDILNTFKEAEQTLQSSEIEPLRKMMLGIVQKYKEGGNSIDGETYQALTRKGAPLDRLMNSNDPNIAYSAGQIRDALDGTLERSAPPSALSDLRTARSQWKALKTVEPLAAKSATGEISPALLMGQASKSYGTATYGKGSDLVDLARIGQQFLKEAPSSGSGERILLHNALLGGGLGGAGGLGIAGLVMNPSAIPMAALATGAGLAGSRIGGALLRSPYLANKMIQNSLGQVGANYLLRAVPEGIAVPQVNRRQPLDLTVRRPNKLQ
jgi:hypothetical protein